MRAKKYVFIDSNAFVLFILFAFFFTWAAMRDLYCQIIEGFTVIEFGNLIAQGYFMIFVLLFIGSLFDSTMIIKTDKYLFSFNPESALCVSLRDVSLDDAICIAMRVTGRNIEGNIEEKLSENPKSYWPRKIYYMVIVVFYIGITFPFLYFLYYAYTHNFFFKVLVVNEFIIDLVVLILNFILLYISIFKRDLARFLCVIFRPRSNNYKIFKLSLSNKDIIPSPSWIIKTKHKNSITDSFLFKEEEEE